eukprot:scaffold9343_cov189-Ochromonas_danica.AAC.7
MEENCVLLDSDGLVSVSSLSEDEQSHSSSSYDSLRDEVVPYRDEDLASIQRRRRMRRVQIMKEKRRQSRGRGQTPMSAVPYHFQTSSASASDCSSITDPKILRKLKNRESAARSRQRKDDLVDRLTCQLCECYVLCEDLQTEQQRLSAQLNESSQQQNMAVGLPFQPSFPMNCLDLDPAAQHSTYNSLLGNTNGFYYSPSDNNYGVNNNISLLSDFAVDQRLDWFADLPEDLSLLQSKVKAFRLRNAFFETRVRNVIPTNQEHSMP